MRTYKLRLKRMGDTSRYPGCEVKIEAACLHDAIERASLDTRFRKCDVEVLSVDGGKIANVVEVTKVRRTQPQAFHRVKLEAIQAQVALEEGLEEAEKRVEAWKEAARRLKRAYGRPCPARDYRRDRILPSNLKHAVG